MSVKYLTETSQQMERLRDEYMVPALEAPTIIINETPIKCLQPELGISPEDLRRQADVAAGCLVYGDYKQVRSTCIDERGRAGTRNGQSPAPRIAVPGGDVVWGLYIAELTGFGLQGSAAERLEQVRQQHNLAGLLSGGHDNCAANGGFVSVMGLLKDNSAVVKGYAKSQLGETYRENLADAVIAEATRVADRPDYADWSEAILGDVYGEEAGVAIETLFDVPHEGLTLVRDKINNSWLDQTRLYRESVVGKGSFVFIDAYSEIIENIWSSGPDAVMRNQQAEHAREMALCAVALAVPNPVLYQIELR